MEVSPESGASAPNADTSRPASAAAPGDYPLAYTDPGRHKRGTNPCTPRSWRRSEALRRRRSVGWEAEFASWAHELLNASNLTPQQRGNAWSAPRTSN